MTTKIAFAFVLPLLLLACHSRQQNAVVTSTPQQTKQETITQTDYTPTPVTEVKTATVSAAPSAQKIVVTTPKPRTTASTAAPSKTTVQQATTVPAPVEPEIKAPLAQQPTFDHEDTIDLTNRLLHPYASESLEKDKPQQAPWAYEQLKYGIYYSFVKAGTAYIHNRGLMQINGRPTYLLQTTAFSAAAIDAVFKVRDINQSWLDAAELYSLGYGQSVREGNYKRDEWLTFDYTNHQYRGQIRKKEAPKNIQGPLEIKVLDVLSALYYVRAQKIEIGRDIIFDIVNREKQYPLVVKVLKKETVKTAAGKFNCVVVEPQIREEGIFVSKGKSLKVWLTDDEYKMPVKMSVEVFIGSVSAELLAYQRQAPTNIL
ncbi:MAG: DUF3108 domain-containing protein [Elusimicrobiaceae bacterium]|nr:DUF3108 domain-containing protein [Elusimicrobiaceae bacterium]